MPCASGKPGSPRGTGRRGWWAPRMGSKGLQGCQGCEHRSNCFLPVSPRISFHWSSCSFGKLLTMISDTRGKATLWPSWKEKSPGEMAWAQPQPGEMNEELTVKSADGPRHRAGRAEGLLLTPASWSEFWTIPSWRTHSRNRLVGDFIYITCSRGFWIREEGEILVLDPRGCAVDKRMWVRRLDLWGAALSCHPWLALESPISCFSTCNLLSKTDLRYTVGSIPDYCYKTNIAIKKVALFFWFPSAYKN